MAMIKWIYDLFKNDTPENNRLTDFEIWKIGVDECFKSKSDEIIRDNGKGM